MRFYCWATRSGEWRTTKRSRDPVTVQRHQSSEEGQQVLWQKALSLQKAERVTHGECLQATLKSVERPSEFASAFTSSEADLFRTDMLWMRPQKALNWCILPLLTALWMKWGFRKFPFCYILKDFYSICFKYLPFWHSTPRQQTTSDFRIKTARRTTWSLLKQLWTLEQEA